MPFIIAQLMRMASKLVNNIISLNVALTSGKLVFTVRFVSLAIKTLERSIFTVNYTFMFEITCLEVLIETTLCAIEIYTNISVFI